MAFLDPTVITAASVKLGLGSTSSTNRSSLYGAALPTPVATSVNTTIKGSVGGISAAVAIANNLPSAAQQLEKVAIASLATAATPYLQQGLQSLTATFSTAPLSLATGISAGLASIFKNSNVSAASTTTTLVPDPVYTNLLTQSTPNVGSFKVSSLEAGSEQISISGSNSSFGTGATSMTGVTLSTVLNRYNLDSSDLLGTSIADSTSLTQLNGLFSPLTQGISTSNSLLAGNALGTSAGLTSQPLTASGFVPGSVAGANTMANYLGYASPLQDAVGGSSLFSSYYQTDPKISLVDDTTRNPVSTNSSGVDASVANAILTIIRSAGCQTTASAYLSFSTQASLFNLTLSFAALSGMSLEVGDLLGCSHASTSLGQQALVGAFTSSCGSQLAVSNTILPAIQDPTTLNTPYVAGQIVTNSSLTKADVATVNNMFTTLGTTTDDALSVSSLSYPNYPVYDLDLISQAQPDFIDGVFGDSTLTDALNGSPMSVQSNGLLEYA